MDRSEKWRPKRRHRPKRKPRTKFGLAWPKVRKNRMASKVRADQLLVQLGLAESRTRAQALILSGNVFAGEKRVAKAGDMLAEDALLTVKGRDHPWVSRGGIKLDHGLTHFGFGVTGDIALDVGSSTGGFTDVLLSGGAAKV